jgi:hypothetical protein
LTWGASFAWAIAYVGGAVLLAAPATLIARKRGLGAGVLAAWVTLVVSGLAVWLGALIWAAAFPTNRFAAGFGLSIILGWMGLFAAPAMTVGLVWAYLTRRGSRRAAETPEV